MIEVVADAMKALGRAFMILYNIKVEFYQGKVETIGDIAIGWLAFILLLYFVYETIFKKGSENN